MLTRGKKLKICTLTNTYNSQEYLWYALKSIYDWTDLLVVIDGAFNDRMPSRISSDQTTAIVKKFPDFEKKIRFEVGAGSNQLEQRGKVLKYLKGFDWLFIVDDDEIYKPEDLKKLRQFLSNTKDDAFKIGGFTFFNSFDWYRWVADPRLWRVKANMKFVGSNNLVGHHAKYDRNKMKVVPGIAKYHYSYVRDVKRWNIRIEQTKVEYPYTVEGRFFVRKGVSFRKFKGEHPEIMENHPYRKIKWHP